MCQAEESDPRYEERELLLKELEKMKNVNEKILVKYIKKIKDTYTDNTRKYPYHLKEPMKRLAEKRGISIRAAETYTQLFEMFKEIEYLDYFELLFLIANIYTQTGHIELSRKTLALTKEFVIGDQAMYVDMIRKYLLD